MYRVTCKSQCGEINESAWETPEGFRSQTREHGTRTRFLIALQRNVRKTSESTSEGTIGLDTFVLSLVRTFVRKYFRTFVRRCNVLSYFRKKTEKKVRKYCIYFRTVRRYSTRTFSTRSCMCTTLFPHDCNPRPLGRGWMIERASHRRLAGQPPAATASPKMPRSLSYRLHDALNVPLVGALSSMCIAGLIGAMDAHLVTKIFITYIAIDTTWIAFSPSAVPRYAWAIVIHHVLTFMILLHPLRFPEHAIETCRDGIVELNTFFLIARRCVKALRKIVFCQRCPQSLSLIFPVADIFSSSRFSSSQSQ